MGEGMASFAGADLTEGTTTMDDYNLYCHYVAGLVGEGLSRLFARLRGARRRAGAQRAGARALDRRAECSPEGHIQ